MRVDEKILKALLAKDEPVCSKDIAFTLNISEKTVKKYINMLKDIVPNYGATIITKQRVGSYIVVHEPEAFNQFLAMQSNAKTMDDPILRKRYILTRLILSDDFINIYDLADEISCSTSLIRDDLKGIKNVSESYSLKLVHSHSNGYRILGEETDIRRCLVHECRESSFIKNTFVQSSISKNAIDIIHKTVKEVLSHFNISVSEESINSLTLHILISINRIETNNAIELDDTYDSLKFKSTPEYFASTHIIKKLESILNVQFTDDEITYLTMHISGQQRLYYHEYLRVAINDKALLFYNRLLRNVLQYADEDFFNDKELRTSLLNHIVPFISRVENNMQIEKSEINNIKNEFPYAYDLAVAGLAFLKEDGYSVNEIEISYFALHLQLSLEKRKQSNVLKYNVLVYSNEITSIFHMLSYKLTENFKDKINEIVFTSSLDKFNHSAEDFQLLLNTTNTRENLPTNTINISHYINAKDIDIVSNAFKQLDSKIMNTIMLKDYLFFEFDASNRNEVFRAMTEKINKTIKLPDDFISRLNDREELASTEYDNRIAIPHPLKSEDLPGFIAVARLSKPILWNTKQVQLVFLICNGSDSNPLFYTKLVHIIQSTEASQNLLQAKTFNEFTEILEKL